MIEALGLTRRNACGFILSSCMLGLSPLAFSQNPASQDSPWEVNDAAPDPVVNAPPHPSALALQALGRRLFFDPRLSASHRVACASCHDPAHAYGPPNALPAQKGGADLRAQGLRAVPSLRYLATVPVFTEHYFDEAVDESVDQGAAGGLTWDGRATSAQIQARIPLLSPLEMANADMAQVARSIATSAYAAEFRTVFGQNIFDDPAMAFDAATLALSAFQQIPAEFFPYNSKYDAYLRQQTRLTPREARGLDLFNNPDKGNCAHCHPSALTANGAFPVFTDFGYVAIGAPRNRTLAANRDPNYFDLGLCGPLRHDLAAHTEYCGMFRAPTLRNVVLRHSFFHNGVFHSLKQVLRFYVERDTRPEKWYARGANGAIVAFDDLPAEYRRNIDHEPPLNRGPNDKPALSETEMDDIIAFLGTLSDGWKPARPACCAAGGLPAKNRMASRLR